MGKNFRGVYHLLNDTIMLFKAGEERPTARSRSSKGIDNPRLQEMFPLEMDQLRMEVELVNGASHPFNLENSWPACRRRCSSVRRSTTSACARSCRRW
jgi:peptide chain release factor 3